MDHGVAAIVVLAAIVGVHHTWKYLLPVLRVTKTPEAWVAFKARGYQYDLNRENHR